MIPFQHFYKMLDQESHLIALEELIVAQAVAQGYAHARSGKDPKVRMGMRSLKRRAFPKIYPDWQ